MKKFYYKEFKLFGLLFAVTKVGISIVTENGNYGFRLYTDSIGIKKGFSEKYYYWSK